MQREACLEYLPLYVTGFVKRGLPHTSNLPTLENQNIRLGRGIAFKFGQHWLQS